MLSLVKEPVIGRAAMAVRTRGARGPFGADLKRFLAQPELERIAKLHDKKIRTAGEIMGDFPGKKIPGSRIEDAADEGSLGHGLSHEQIVLALLRRRDWGNEVAPPFMLKG